MATNYPSGLDTYTNPAGTDALSTGHASQHANVNDAVEAIEAELGTTPSGSAATVKARFEAIETNDWVTTARIANSQVTSAKIADATITGSDIATGTVTSTNILDATITGTDIASGTVTSTNILDGTIVNADISASAAIIGTKLADGAITPIKTSGGYLDKSTAYSITNDDRVLDVTGTTTVTLPTSASNSGRAFFVRNSGTATVTIATTSSQTIDGASTLTIPGKGFLEVVADGSNWHVIRGQYAGDETYGRRIFSWNHAYSTGGGWQQVYGDTGIRAISSWDAAGTVTGTALPTGWGPVSGEAGFYRLQRVGSRVTATIQMLQATSTNPTPLSVPAGFTSGSNAPQFLVPMVPGSGPQVSRTWQQAGGLGRGAITLFTANDYVYQAEFTWLTPDAWPASLPGAAVGVIPL